MTRRSLALLIALIFGSLLNEADSLGLGARDADRADSTQPSLMSQKEIESRKAAAFARATRLLSGRGLPFDARALLNRGWRKELHANLSQMPEMRLHVEHAGPIDGVVIADTVNLPESWRIAGDTIVIARNLRFDKRQSNIRVGPHALYVFAIEPVEFGEGGSPLATVHVDARGWGRDNRPPGAQSRGASTLQKGIPPGNRPVHDIDAMQESAGLSGELTAAATYGRQYYDYTGWMGADGNSGADGDAGDAGSDGSTGSSVPCGEGGHGTDGGTGGTGGDGEAGDYGEDGGIGGDGGYAMFDIYTYHMMTITIDASGGMGGWGGNGGKGGRGGGGGSGGSGGDANPCEGVPTNGGSGGSGGDGGFGGNGGDGGDGGPGGAGGSVWVTVYSLDWYTTCDAIADGGRGGSKGVGGGKGASGAGGPGGAGGQGQNGGTSGSAGSSGTTPGEYAQKGQDGMDGSDGMSGFGDCVVVYTGEWTTVPTMLVDWRKRAGHLLLER